ncbi:MAG: hypothetical protein IPH20_21340 [Bacteroidales bacterium]|nr:hypothetical protein [Bacteroidales bacterium]
MNTNRISLRFAVITAIVASLALSRLLPHPFNFSPIAAMALFGERPLQQSLYRLPASTGCRMDQRFISELCVLRTFRYLSMKGFVCFAAFAVIRLAGSVALKSFPQNTFTYRPFSVRDLLHCVKLRLYGRSAVCIPFSSAGILACYAAAIPFFRNTLAGDLIYTFAVFYAFEYAQNRISLLKVPALKF